MTRNRKSIKIQKGDVFQFSLSDHICGYGQIVVTGDVIYVVIFKDVFRFDEPWLDADKLPEIALCGWTLDGRIYHKMWRVVGNSPLVKDIPYPCYKVANDGILWVESFDGQLKRPASENDCRSLDYRTTVAPIRFEKALSAIHNICDWDKSFDKICVEYCRKREHTC